MPGVQTFNTLQKNVFTADSTSISSGTLVLLGGLGIYKNINIGGNQTVLSTVDSSSITTGSTIISGGVGISKALYIGKSCNITTSGNALFLNTAYSTDLSAGGFCHNTLGKKQNTNNCYVEKYIHSTDGSTNNYVLLSLYGNDTLRLTGENRAIINPTIGATSTSTGALTVNGGIGANHIVAGTATVTDAAVLNSTLSVAGASTLKGNSTMDGVVAITNTTVAVDSSSGALKVAGGMGVQGDVYLQGTLTVAQTLTAQDIVYEVANYVTSTADSSSATTGAVQVAGGVGMAKNLFVGMGAVITEGVTINSTVGSTSTTTGALKVAGGVGIAENVNVGGGITVGSASSFAGNVTVPTQVYDDNSTLIASDAFVKTQIMTQNTVMIAPMGFENQTDSAVSYNSTTRVLSIAPTSTSFNVWVKGQRHTFSAQVDATAHADTAGLTSYYYFDSDFLLQRSSSFPSLSNYALVAFVYYYSDAIYLVTEERHGCVMDPATHAELHNQIGTYFVSGLAAADYTVAPVVPTDSDNQMSFATGVISDEQLNSTITALSAAGPYSIVQLTGENGIWSWTGVNTVPFHYATDSFIQFNELSGGSWTLSPVPDGDYVNYYVLFVPSFTASTQVLIIPGQQSYNTLSNAKAESFYLLNTSTIPVPEFLPLYQITYGTSSLYTSTGLCRIEAFTRLVGSRVSILNNSGNNHETLSGLQLAGPEVTWGHISDQSQTIAGAKEFLSTTQSTSSSTGAIIVDGGLGVAKDAFIGGNLNIQGSLAFQAATIQATTLATSTTTGALQVVGGIGANHLFAGAATVSGASVLDGTLSVAGITSVLNTTQSTSSTTGALIVAGGLGVSKALHADGVIFANTGVKFPTGTSYLGVPENYIQNKYLDSQYIAMNGFSETHVMSLYTPGSWGGEGASNPTPALQMSSNWKQVYDPFTTTATSTSTGAFVVAGGIGANHIVAGSETITGAAVLGSTLTVAGASTLTGAAVMNNTLSVAGIVSLLNTEQSTSSSTGALKVAGGLGVEKDAFIGGITRIENTTASTSASTGALVIAGGVGVEGDLHVTGSIAFDSTLNSTSPTTGSLVLLGGLGIAKDFVAGGELIEITNSWGKLENRVVNLGSVITVAPAATQTVYTFTVTAPTCLNISIMGYDETTKLYQALCSTVYVFMLEGEDPVTVISSVGDSGSPESLWFNYSSSGWNFQPGAFSFIDNGSGSVSIQFTNNGTIVDDFIIGSVSVTKQIGAIH